MNRRIVRFAAVLAVVAGSMLVACDAQAFFGCCRRQTTCCYQPVVYTYYSVPTRCGDGYCGSSCSQCNSGCGCSSGYSSGCGCSSGSCGYSGGCSSCSASYTPTYQPTYVVRPAYAPTYVGYSTPYRYDYQQVGARVRMRY